MARFTATEAHDLACFRSHSGKAHGDTEPGPYSDIGISRYESVGEESDGAVVVDGRIRRYPTKRFMRWLTNVEREFRTQLKGMQPYLPIQGECYAIVEYVPGDLITRDLPGMQDAVWHMCERFGIITNDKWFQHLIWITRPMDRADPRLSLRIVPGSWSLEWAIRDLSGGVKLTSSLLCP